jgi:hypothetical protein
MDQWVAEGSPEAGGPPSASGKALNLQPLRRGDGYYSISPRNNQYGDPRTIQAIEEAGDLWMGLHPDKPFGVGDISLPSGGNFPPHRGHRLGLDFDLRPFRSDGLRQAVHIGHPAYSRALTQDLMNVLRLDPRVRVILFNDPLVTGVQSYPGHSNHLHVGLAP